MNGFKKRPWFQVRIRSVLFLLVLFAVALFGFQWINSRAKQQAEVVHWVRTLEGSVTYDFQMDEWNKLNKKTKPDNIPSFLLDWLGVDFFCDVVSVKCYKDIISAERNALDDVSSIGKLKRLRSLSIAVKEGTDLSALSELRELESIVFGRSSVVENMKWAKKLKKLLYFQVGFGEIKDIEGIENCSNLENFLLLGRTKSRERQKVKNIQLLGKLGKIKDLRLEHVAQRDFSFLEFLPNLQTVFLSNTDLVEFPELLNPQKMKTIGLDKTKLKSLKGFEKMTNLKMVCFSRTDVKDISPLSNLKKLSWLTANRPKFSDLGPVTTMPSLMVLSIGFGKTPDLTPLKHCKSLQSLTVGGSEVKVDQEQVKELKKIHPKLTIDFS